MEARAWRRETQVALRKQTIRARRRSTVSEAGEAWLAAAKKGVIRTRSGTPYKPSALRGYEAVLRAASSPRSAPRKLSKLDRNTLQA